MSDAPNGSPKGEHEVMLDQAKRSHAIAAALFGEGTLEYYREAARQLGKDILHDELNKEPKPLAIAEPYDLSKSVQDSLIAHTRQDVAMSYALLETVLRRVFEQEKQIKTLVRIAWANFALVVVILMIGFR